MDLMNQVPSRCCLRQKVRLMLDRTPNWPHLSFGEGEISALSDQHVKIEGILNDLGLNGTFSYEVEKTKQGATSVRLEINSNAFNISQTKTIVCDEIKGQCVTFYNSDNTEQIARLEYPGEFLIPRGIEVFHNDGSSPTEDYRMLFDYEW